MRAAYNVAMDTAPPPEPENITLGILAGGLATRLGGVDKAWLLRDGIPQVLRIAGDLRAMVADVVVSANRNLPAYAQAGIASVTDVHPGIGPIGGLHALSAVCTTPWLLTVPVDIHAASSAVAALLGMPASGQGAYVEDLDGIQPLVALWPRDTLRAGVAVAISSADFSVQSLQRATAMRTLRIPDIRIGNLNTPLDLTAAGMLTA